MCMYITWLNWLIRSNELNVTLYVRKYGTEELMQVHILNIVNNCYYKIYCNQINQLKLLRVSQLYNAKELHHH